MLIHPETSINGSQIGRDFSLPLLARLRISYECRAAKLFHLRNSTINNYMFNLMRLLAGNKVKSLLVAETEKVKSSERAGDALADKVDAHVLVHQSKPTAKSH